MKTGDAVVIHCAGNRVDGHVGMMPVLRGEDGVYRSVMTGSTVEIKPKT
jgi:hypothetical protein